MKQHNLPTEYSNQAIGALADAFGKGIETIRRWIANNDDRLTSERAIRTLEALRQSEVAINQEGN